jgi:hypothetical protein
MDKAEEEREEMGSQRAREASSKGKSRRQVARAKSMSGLGHRAADPRAADARGAEQAG